MESVIDIETIISLIKTDLTKVLISSGGFGKAKYLLPPKNVIDDTTKIVIYNKRNRKIAVIICSLLKYSDLPERNLEFSQEIKKTLGSQLGNVIINPLLFGNKNGISFVVWPFYKPISSFPLKKHYQLNKIKKPLLNWMRISTQHTRTKVNQNEIEKDFITPLNHFFKNKKLSTTILNETEKVIHKLNEKKWHPYYVLAHNDLWKSNILLNKDKEYNFVIIDWAGASLKSFAIYDLIRICFDLNISKDEFLRELELYCKILCIELEDSKCYLLASMAYLGINLEQFPEDMYLNLVEITCNFLFSALDKE